MAESQDALASALLRRYLAQGETATDEARALDAFLQIAERMALETAGQPRGEPWRRLLRAVNAELAATMIGR